MHIDEVVVNVDIVRKLLSEQFPHFADLDLALVDSHGTENVLFKLGDESVLRFPRTVSSSKSLEEEITIIPYLEAHLPIATPSLKGLGKPNNQYPFPWCIYSWLEGENFGKVDPINMCQTAKDLGNFILALQKVAIDGRPICKRGQPLRFRDDETKKAIVSCEQFFDCQLLRENWLKCLDVEDWRGDPVWIHGDLHEGNILFHENKISAVLDFGLSGIGDPSVDYMVAWSLFDRESRAIFRAVTQPDEATWERARGWALNLGVVAYPYYIDTNPRFAAIAKRMVDEVLADV